MRSSARKSGIAIPVSASSTAASVTPGTSCPLATSCVPTSTARSPSRNAARVASGFFSAGPVAEKRSTGGSLYLPLALSSDDFCGVML